VSPVRYVLGFYVPEDDIPHSHRREVMTPVRYELGFYITEDGVLHSHRRENFKSFKISFFVGIAGQCRYKEMLWLVYCFVPTPLLPHADW
jgi:hypothetical protein